MALMANQEAGEERIPDDGELEGSDNFVKVDNHYRCNSSLPLATISRTLLLIQHSF